MKRKILSLILVAVMLLNIEATSVFAMDGSTLSVQEGGTTIDASGDVDPACTCEAVVGEVHAEDCPQYIAPDEPEQPVDPSESAEPEQPVDSSDSVESEQSVDSSDSVESEQSVEPVCTCETKCAGDTIDTECPVCSAEDADLAACAGESAADPAVAAARELIAALPDAETLTEMSTEEQNQVYDALLAADEAYQALNEEQKGQLAEENAKLDALFAYFNNPNMAAPAAEAVSYVEYSWNSGTSTLSTAEWTTTDYIEVTGSTTAWENGKTYVVNDTVTIGQRVTIEGSVSLILTDGCALTVNGGIEVLQSDSETLTIYAQSGGTGRLTATADGDAAGIGGTNIQKGGTVNVHGGTVIATANGGGSGIGGSSGGLGGAGGTVNVYSGSVTATGITGIGGGDGAFGSGGTTNIYGGFVTATAKSGAGIGGAAFSGGDNSASSTNIYGGVVTAVGGEVANNPYRDMSAGIGGGSGNRGGAVTISGGIVNAEAGSDAAAIGNGEEGSGVAVTRTGGMIFEKNSGKLYGTTFTLPVDYSIPAGKTLTIAAGQTLIIPAGRTLTVNGPLVNNGKIQNNGTLILGASASQVSGSGHMTFNKKEAGKLTLGDGIYRTASDGVFQTAVSGQTAVEGAFDYFEYVGAGHLTATAADVDSHTIACKDVSCPLYLSGVQMDHDMSGQVCTTCGYTFYDVWVSGVQVSGIADANGNIDVTSLVGDASKVSGTVTYAPSTRTLTLSGASITGREYEDTIYSVPALNLVLTGENSITGDYGILINRARLTIGGSGSLTLDVNNYGISAYSLMVEGVTVNIDSGTANTGAIDLDAGGTIKDSTVKAVGESSEYQKASIYTDRGTLEIDSSSVYVESGYVGIYGNSDVSVILNGDVHVKVDGKIMVSGGVTGVNDGYLRGTRGGTFEHKEAGALESTDTYFEYVGEGHYTFSPVAGSEEHAIICVDDDCILKLTNAVAPHIWNEHADGAACGVCKAEATASVTADGTTAYYGGIDNAVSAAESSSNAILKLLDDVETIAVAQGGFILDPNSKLITKLSLGDDCQSISIAAQPANIPAVSAVDYGVFAKPYGGVALEAEWFTSDMTGYVVVKDGDNLKLTEGITEDMVEVDEAATYNGSAQPPEITVRWTDGNIGGMLLTKDTNYTVSYTDSKGNSVTAPTYADTYTVTIIGVDYAGEVEKTYTIEPKSLEDATVAAPNQTYTGSRLTPTVTVELTDYTITSDDYDVSYSPDTLTDAGSYTITVTGKGNFKDTATSTFTIDRAAALTFSGEMNVANKLEHSYTFDLSTIVPGNHGVWGSDSAVEYVLDVNITMDGYYDGNNHPASISGHVLTLPIQEVNSDAEGFIGTVTVTIKSQNYEDSTLTITVYSANKETVEITGVTAKDGIYNGSAQQGYTGTPTSAFGATGYEITYTGRGSTSYDSATAPTGAGDYTVTFKVPDSNPDYMGAKSLDFSIAPKPLFWNTGSVTVSQAYVPDQVDVEDTSSISSITLSGVISGDDVNWTGTVQSAEFADDNIGENKTVTVILANFILTGTDAANYTAPATTFTITGRITDPENTKGDETLGTLEGGLIVSGGKLPTDAEMDEVYGAKAAEALRTKFGGTNVMKSIQTALKEAAAKTADANSSNMNHKVLEIFLEYYDNDGKEWLRITGENLDDVKNKISGGVPVTIPFDLFSSDINSSNYGSYDFLLHHMITLPLDNTNVGDIEQLTVTVDASGLHATVENGFSPFVISYAKKPTGSSGGSSSGSSGNSSSSDSSSGGSASTYKDGEYDFWIGVKAQIEVVKSGTTLRVSAGDYTRMPIEVMNALRARSNVTLNITWNGGNDISIPSALAPTPESHRVYYELSELATVFPAKAAAVPVQAADTDTEEESPASTSPATGDTDGETGEPEGEKIATEEETSEGTAPETEEMIQEETGEEETKEGCIWHWLMLLFMLACVLFIVIGERKPLKTALIALGVDAAFTVIVMIAGSCSLDIPFALGTLLVAGASIPVKNVSRNCE